EVYSAIPCPSEGTYRDRHGTLGAGCDGRGGVRRLGAGRERLPRTAKSCGPGAATLASIRPACAGAATVTKKAAHRGEHEGNRKTIARGRPGCSGCTCSDYARVLFCFAREAAGAISARLPRALCSREGQRDCTTRAKTYRENER